MLTKHNLLGGRNKYIKYIHIFLLPVITQSEALATLSHQLCKLSANKASLIFDSDLCQITLT